MSTRKIAFTNNEYYHIYNRGNSKQNIFYEQNDYYRFIKLLFVSNGEDRFKISWIKDNVFKFDRGKTLVDIGAYCLMPNHFHILLRQNISDGVTKFMQKISTGYSMYYNCKHKRVGSLFEGKFKSENVKDDRHLKYLFSYIHLNPIKLIDSHWKEKGIKNKKAALNFLDKYIFSSYQDYAGYNRMQNKILNKKVFPDYFSKRAHEGEILDWLSYNQ